VDIPFTLGTEPIPDLNQQLISNPLIVSCVSKIEQSMLNHDGDDDGNLSVSDSVQEIIYFRSVIKQLTSHLYSNSN
jgi:hypothetical protein